MQGGMRRANKMTSILVYVSAQTVRNKIPREPNSHQRQQCTQPGTVPHRIGRFTNDALLHVCTDDI